MRDFIEHGTIRINTQYLECLLRQDRFPLIDLGNLETRCPRFIPTLRFFETVLVRSIVREISQSEKLTMVILDEVNIRKA